MRNARGISPVITTILLVVIAIAAVTAFAAWYFKTQKTQTKNPQAFVNSAYVTKVNDTYVKLTVSVTNKGNTPLNLTEIDFMCPNTNQAVEHSLASSVSIAPSQIVKVEETIDISTCGNWDDISGYGSASILLKFRDYSVHADAEILT